jgi:serine protease AprX
MSEGPSVGAGSASDALPSGDPDRRPRLIQTSMVADALVDPEERRRIGLSEADDEPLAIVVELNMNYPTGLTGAEEQLLAEWNEVRGDQPEPAKIADTYYRGELSAEQVRRLAGLDLAIDDPVRRAIYRIWPDFEVRPLIDRSSTTVKADAARRSYAASGRGVRWAVIDSGIDGTHPHFTGRDTLRGDVEHLHRDFTTPGEPGRESALTDPYGHGTHVAGIIAGGLKKEDEYAIVEQEYDPVHPKVPRTRRRTIDSAELLAGMAPDTKLVSLRVLDDRGRGSSMNVLRALEYVRKEINGQSKLMRVHGVNVSVGYEFDAKWFACGQSPLCVEVDRLVRSGVVVVVAAGNTGYGPLSTLQRTTNVGLTMTINDPGNANLAITVGATHRDAPHTYGVSYFSSKGPTGDGRNKPDLVAPGERIVSCAAGRMAREVYPDPAEQPADVALYVEDSGTSMAAPHVSGAIASFLSIRQEFIGQPEEVRRIFCQAATSLRREPYFQGSGLVDLMRAIQAV